MIAPVPEPCPSFAEQVARLFAQIVVVTFFGSVAAIFVSLAIASVRWACGV